MTEDEAKTKVCHRTLQRVDTIPSRVARPDNCIGSACMAWRVEVIPAGEENEYNTAEPPPGDGWKPMTDSPRNCGWWRTAPEKRVGYCGLAGKP